MKPIEIINRNNPKIKFLKQLQQKKYRDQFQKFFVENTVLICDALESEFFFESLFVTENFIKKNEKKFEFILDHTNAKEYYLISEKVNRSFSNLDTAPGICAIYHKKRKEIDFTAPLIYLNGINNPGNLGTILRSALAFDLENIIVDEKCADVYNPKTIGAAKDAIFKLNVVSDKNLKTFDQIKKEMKVFSTSLESSDTLDVLKNEKPFCLILGSESHGIDKELQEMSDGCIRIEMGKKIESLNVASASAIIFYEIYKMRK